MENIIQQLFAARDIAHRIHLRTRSFAAHLALGDLYKSLVDLADNIAEVHQGKYGLLNVQDYRTNLSDNDAVTFIRQLAAWAEETKASLPQHDSHMLNEWDNVISTIYRAKYKLENLS